MYMHAMLWEVSNTDMESNNDEDQTNSNLNKINK